MRLDFELGIGGAVGDGLLRAVEEEILLHGIENIFRTGSLVYLVIIWLFGCLRICVQIFFFFFFFV